MLGNVSSERSKDTKINATHHQPSRSIHCWRGVRDLPIMKFCLYNSGTDQELWEFMGRKDNWKLLRRHNSEMVPE